MQNISGSTAAYPQREGLLSRVFRILGHREKVVARPPTRWAEMKPIDFEGEDTSLTQSHLDLLR